MILFIVETLDSEEDKKFILEVYNKYAPMMRARAYSFTKDYETSADLAHECIIKLIPHTDKLRTFNDSQLRAYIAIAIDHISINYTKHSSRTCLLSDDEECFFENIADPDDVENAVETKFSYDELRKNFQLLPERDKTLIVLKYDLELSDRDIAPLIGIKENSVRMTVNRSVRRLGQKMKGAKTK